MPIQDKERERKYMAAWYAKNRDRQRAAQKVWRQSARGVDHRFNRTLRKHGITRAQWHAMLEAQDAKCAGCLDAFETTSDVHVDHCHSTGVVRGLLCAACNLAIGKLKDCPLTLRRLALYLESVSKLKVA